MNTGMLSNPAPSSGQNTVFGNIPPSSAPAQGALASMTPSIHNNVKEPFVNPVASYPVAVRPYSSGWEHMLHPGDVIFVNSSVRSDRAGELHQRFKPQTVANLPLLNYFLRQKGPHKEPQLHKPGNWRYLGIMRNDMQMTGTDAYRNNAGTRQQHAQRMINVDVRGSSRVFNYWAGARVGDNLYLKSVEVDMRQIPEQGYNTIQNVQYANKAFVEKTRALEKAIKTATGDERNNLDAELKVHESSTCVQILPYILSRAPDSSISTQALKLQSQQRPFINSKPLNSTAPLVSIGWCFQHLGPAEESDQNSAIWNATQFYDDRFKLPTIPFFVRI